ncbi:predicted protein [Uncinocarpus reesii 1704]|uniref:DUF8035 domain-containing protein n=1 Tax=Uncinocarpus reesii (strain UAMH 1704) TaxID=336963 RepID=C4JFV0_UNCRE|nr:uncharacterized protein UREG_02434 [Uncinocarpus reesii 1704]EEP77585.1 predicted protein [Uncinocarpus reesii 1704]
MSRYGDTASSTTASSSGAGGRWDAERFMREREVRHEPSRRERRTAVQVVGDRVEKRGPSFVEEYLNSQARYGPPARRPDRDYEDEHLISTSDAIIPFKERRTSPSPPRKPRLLRRQSSLDTFDRAATRLASDYYRYDRDDYGPPVVPVAVPRRHSPPSESDLDSIRVAEPDYYGDEVFRRVREADRSATPRGRRYSLREEIVKEKIERPYPRRGKTRVPKHLVHPRALIDLGYQFEEVDGNIIIFQALGKENIDELVTFSREIRRKTRVEEIKGKERVVTRTRESVSVERTRSKSRRRSPSVIRQKAEFLEVEPRRTRRVSPSPAPAPTPRTRPRRRSSPVRIVEPRHVEEVIQPNTDVALILPARHRRSDREIRAEIRALEEERRLLSGRETLSPGDVVEVRRDYKGE